MKRYIVCWILCLECLFVMAQQEMAPNTYLQDPYRFNSACSGFSYGLNLSLSYANQWVGMEGAPKEISLSAYQLLRETNFSIGALLFCERSGVTKRVEAEIAGTYRFLISDWTWLSLSVGGGVRVLGKDDELLQRDGDPYFDKQLRREVVPRFRMGAWLRCSDGTSFSFSVKGVGVGHLNAFGHKQSTHFYWSGEKVIPLRQQYKFVLNGLVYVAKNAPFALLFAPAVRSHKMWELGIAYQTGRVFTPYLKLNRKDLWGLGVSYTYSMLRSMSYGECSSFSLQLNCRVASQEKGRERLYRNAPF